MKLSTPKNYPRCSNLLNFVIIVYTKIAESWEHTAAMLQFFKLAVHVCWHPLLLLLLNSMGYVL